MFNFLFVVVFFVRIGWERVEMWIIDYRIWFGYGFDVIVLGIVLVVFVFGFDV